MKDFAFTTSAGRLFQSLFVDSKSMASGDLRWQEFEENSWIDSVKSSHDFVGLDHVSSFSSVLK